MDTAVPNPVTLAKELGAYRIINQQIAQANTQLKIELNLSEKRSNDANAMLLCTRKENKSLREMVRKLMDQLQVVTKVMISVQDQSEQLFNMINRPHSLAEEIESQRQPRARDVYAKMRIENPPDVHEAVILEEVEEEGTISDYSALSDQGSENISICTGGVNEESCRSSNVKLDETSSNQTVRNNPALSCEPLLPSSPLMQRLKRNSKNISFDESFETIERERAFKLSRHSRICGGLADMPNEVGGEEEDDADFNEIDRQSTDPFGGFQNDGAHFGIDMEESIVGRLRSMSALSNDETNSSTPQASATGQIFARCDKTANNRLSTLKQSGSESMFSSMTRFSVDREDNMNSSRPSYEEAIISSPENSIANVSCSTPVSKDAGSNKISIRTRVLGKIEKAKSETALNMNSMPVVVLRPLTVENVKLLEPKGTRTGRKPKPLTRKSSKIDENMPENSRQPGALNLKAYFSADNLSVVSNESGRPRRKAAPKTLRERPLNLKMRRD